MCSHVLTPLLLSLSVVSLASALVVPSRPRVGGVRLSAEPPALSYAADKPAQEEVTEKSFVGQYELEEREDADESKTLIALEADGKAVLGATDGIPYKGASGRWEYDGKELIVEVTRVYEGTLEEYSTTRVLIGDVISLNDVPPQVSGAVKTSPSPTTDDMLRIPRHSLPDDAVGYFVAVKIPEVPL